MSNDEYDVPVLIPLGTDRPRKHPPVVTYTLLALNVLVFVYMATLERSDPDAHQRLLHWGWIWGKDFHVYALVTSAFLHAGWMHLLGNMLFLWIFSPNIEDKLGKIGFASFYILAGAASGSLHAYFSDSPAIGASGAIAGVTGAYLVLFPRTTIKCLFFFFFIGIIVIPAWWFIAFSIAWDFLSPAIFGNTGIANIAHIGGYIYGSGIAMVLLWTKLLPREPYDLLTTIRQARRRSEIRSAHDWSQREHTRSREKSDPKLAARTEALGLARSKVVSALASQDYAAASRAYTALLSSHGAEASLLSRQRQHDLANHLFENEEYQNASIAYERFILAYPNDREIPHMTLILGLISARYLNDPIRGERLIREALADGLGQEQAAIASQLLEDLGANP